jgi:hypothetical protein
MLTEQVHYSRNAAGITVNRSQRLGFKNLLAV